MSLSERKFDSSLQNEPSQTDIIPKFRRMAQRIGLHNYRYVVATTRRASNFLELVRARNPGVLPQYMTENGLLLQAEEIARFYEANGYFPKIAILDDILVYGRNMNLLLTQLWSTVSQCLSRLNIGAGEDVEDAFNRSISLWIYAINDAPILLRHEFQWMMHCQQMLSNSQWRCLSDSISKLISDRDVANTSYVISAKLKGGTNYRPSVMSWAADDSLRYRDNHYHYSFYLFRLSPKAGVYPSVRSYVKQGFQYFTPYFFMPELNAEQVIRVLLAVFDFSSKQNMRVTNRCINLLNRIKECPSRLMVYAQFTSLLLSQITLSVFFENLDLKTEAKLIYDTEKISRNFGFETDMKPILDRFCQIRWNEKQLIALLDCLGFPDRTDMTVPAAVTEPGYQSTVNSVECLVYKQAVDHERDAVGRKQYHLSGAPSEDLYVNQTGEQELGSFLSRVENWAGIQGNILSMLPVLSCLTQMMDLGDISLKARSKRCNGRSVFYSSVRTTEMSLAIMPRKLSRYYQQFFLLAQLYWRDQDFPDRMEYFFKEIIFGGDPEGKNATMIRNARYFAQLISENQMIVDSMLNWKDLPEFSEM